MQKQEEEIILFTDDKAAQYRTDIKGWVSRTGRYFGKDERGARMDGCTHQKCDCGKLTNYKYQAKCDFCRGVETQQVWRERYNKLYFKEWDGKTALALYDDDKFFWDESDLIEYIEEQKEEDEEFDPNDLMLVICEPNYLYEIWPEEISGWTEMLAEDQEFPKALTEKFAELNEFIKTMKPISWGPGKYRTTYTYKPEANDNV